MAERAPLQTEGDSTVEQPLQQTIYVTNNENGIEIHEKGNCNHSKSKCWIIIAIVVVLLIILLWGIFAVIAEIEKAMNVDTDSEWCTERY